MPVIRHELFQRIFNSPLMMHPGKAQAGLEGMGGRVVDEQLVIVSEGTSLDHVAGRNTLVAGALGDPLGARYDAARRAPYAMIGNVAIIPIEGTLVHKGAYVGASSGLTSYQGIITQVNRVRQDPKVAGVVFEVDSFGGEVDGAFGTAAIIAQLSSEKPTIAILTENACSAAYLLASAARQIVMPETGTAGSIGVITMHTDVSKALKKEGVKVTIITAGARKADGNPLGPLPDEVQSRMQEQVEKTRVIFARVVGQYRGKRFTAAQALATEAATFDGRDACLIGMVDAVAFPATAFEAFEREMRGRRA
ncbi:MAG: hypothetical protein JWM36_3225 [Hyphomicrobiales bacterium]|nr:hypothetical protein [Hyphomicrobiales bacterium]